MGYYEHCEGDGIYDGNFKYTSLIGSAPSRPIGTSYENSSYAYIHRNTLIVTVDVLHQESPYAIIGSLGTVTGAVGGRVRRFPLFRFLYSFPLLWYDQQIRFNF